MSLMVVSLLILAINPIIGVSVVEEPQRTVIARCGEGYLVEDAQGNQILHLKGSPYEMGYQQGVLLSEGVERVTHEYLDRFLFAMIDIDFDGSVFGPLWQFGRKILAEICLRNEKYISEEYRQEMRGVADGAGDSVTYEDVLTLNEGTDVISSIGYLLISAVYWPLSLIPGMSSLESLLPIACNQFAVFGEGTTDGRLFHGRDFMWFIAGFLQDYTIMRVAEPDEGYPFIGVTFPGLVGIYEGMNTQGISCGMDAVTARDCKPLMCGECTLFVCRDVVQYASTLEEGIETIRKAPSYVSWIYGISDGKIPDAAIIEMSAGRFNIRRPQDLYSDQIEEKSCLVATTNHYIHPGMDGAFMDYGLEGSEWRYNYMVGKLIQNYSKIDVNIARDTIDYLHPPNYDYLKSEYRSSRYTDNPSQAVQVSISLFDPGNLEIWSLYGYYDRPWVHCSLKEEIGMG